MANKYGNHIREIRQLKGLTLKDVAKRMGVSNQFVSNYELGKRKLSWPTAIQFAEAFECEPMEIIKGHNGEGAVQDTLEKELLETFRKLSWAMAVRFTQVLEREPMEIIEDHGRNVAAVDDNEKELLEVFRKLDGSAKELYLHMIRSFTAKNSKEVKHKHKH